MRSILRRAVVAALMAFWCLPAAGIAKADPAPMTAPMQLAGAPARTAATAPSAPTGEAQRYAEREKQSSGLQSFEGGEGYIYIGGGVLTAVLLIVLILILI